MLLLAYSGEHGGRGGAEALRDALGRGHVPALAVLRDLAGGGVEDVPHAPGPGQDLRPSTPFLDVFVLV